MFELVIFDMDGVIIDSEPIHQQVERNLFKELGMDVTREEHQGFVGTTSAWMWETLRERYGLSYDIKDLVEKSHSRFLEHLASLQHPEPMPGIVDLMEQLKSWSIKMAVASSSSRKQIETILKLLGISRFFDLIVSGEEVKYGKPAPDIFLRTAEKMGVFPQECVVIEDSENGVKAAKAAGMYCVGFRNLSSGDLDLSAADKVIEGFKNISIHDFEVIYKNR